MPDKYAHIHDELERDGRYDEYTTPINYDTVKPVDGDYVYLPRNPFFRVWRFLITAILRLFGPLVNFFAHGVRVRGRKNLKGIRSAVTVSNHVLYLDYLVMRQALARSHKYYTTVAPHNCKRGLNGYAMKAAGILPFGTTFSADKNFRRAVARLLQGRTFVHFYPEQALWYRYEKPRPYKRGAFTYAVAAGVPVIPCLMCFREPRGLDKLFHRRKCVTVQICKPVYPRGELSAKENASAMRDAAYLEVKEAYEAFYGKPLELPPARWVREGKNE